MFSVHLSDSWLHCQLHCSAAAFSQQQSRPATDQTNRVSQYHVYTVPSEHHGLLLLQSCYSDQRLGVNTPAGQGFIYIFSSFLCKDQVKSNTKGMAWMKSLRKETQISKGSFTDSWIASGLTTAVWSGSWILFLFTLKSVTNRPPYYMHCNVLQSWMRGKTHLKLNFSFEEEGFSLLTVVIT